MADDQANKPHRKTKDTKKKNKTHPDGTAHHAPFQR
jgi:hypothetical protein